MYQHIVIALDGSHNAKLALQHAIGLAQFCHAKLSLVHVASLRDIGVEGVGMLDSHDLHVLANERGNVILNEAKTEAEQAGIQNIETHIAESWEGGKDMARILIEYAEQNAANLIVLGTHGRSGLLNLLMGSFAETLLRMSPLPLLVVRNPHDDDDTHLFSKRPVL